MKFDVKYLSPNSPSGAHFCSYEMPEGLGMRKCEHMVPGCKRVFKPEGGHFLSSHGFSWSYAGPKSNLPRMDISSIGVVNPKNVYF